MAVMINMLPVEQKPNVVTKNSNNASGTKNGKNETGFAKVLTNETDKSATDTDTKNKPDDSVQLLAAMTGLVSPVVPTIVVPIDVNGKNASAISAVQNQVVELMAGQLGTTSTTVGTIPTQVTVPNVVDELKNSGTSPLSAQVVGAVDPKQQSQLTNGVDGKDLSKQPSVVNIGEMTAVIPQVAGNEILSANLPGQTPIKNIQTVGQVPGNDQKNLDVLNANPVVVTALSTTPVVNANNLLKNIGKSSDGKGVIEEVNTEGINGIKNDQVAVLGVKPVVGTQMVADVIDQLADQEKVDVIAPNQTVKDADAFASILNQQGMKVEQTGVAEAKQVTAQPVADPHNIQSQIVDQARLVAGNKNTEMIIQLKPEHLGELTFKVSIENGVVSASFHSNNSEVRNVIESTLYQLKQEMANQGLKVDNVGVYAGLGEFFSNGQQRESQQQPGVKVPVKKTEEDFFEALEAIDPTSSVDGLGVDYRV